MFSQNIKIILIYALVCLIWGSTWLVIKIGLESLTPFLSAGIRFVIASTIILVILKFSKIKIQKDKLSIKLYILMAFVSFVIPYGLVYWSEQFIPSGLASILFAIEPFFIFLFSYFLISSEKIGFFKLAGTIFGFLGIFIIFSDTLNLDFSSYSLGIFAIVLSACLQAINAVLIKKYGGHLHPISMNFTPMLIAGITFCMMGFFLEDISIIKFNSNAVLSILYLAIFGSIVTFTSFYWLLKRINIIILSLISFIIPIIALLLGWIFYNEQLSLKELIGSLFVLFGLLLANFGNMIKLNKLVRKATS